MMKTQVQFPKISFGDVVTEKGLSVVPLFSETTESAEYTLANEMIQSSQVVVKEVSTSGVVSKIVVTNSTKTRVLFVEGEVLSGGETGSDPEYLGSRASRNGDRNPRQLCRGRTLEGQDSALQVSQKRLFLTRLAIDLEGLCWCVSPGRNWIWF
jgi:hypothetical protein